MSKPKVRVMLGAWVSGEWDPQLVAQLMQHSQLRSFNYRVFTRSLSLQGAWVFGEWDPVLVAELLQQMTPANARVDVHSAKWDEISAAIGKVRQDRLDLQIQDWEIPAGVANIQVDHP